LEGEIDSCRLEGTDDRDVAVEGHGLRQDQHRRWRQQHGLRHRNDGADRAGISRLLIAILLAWILAGGELPVAGRRSSAVAQDRDGEGCPRGWPVIVPERERELHGERQERQQRSRPDVRAKPGHSNSTPPLSWNEPADVMM